MSTSLLYHAFGIRGYKYARTKYELRSERSERTGAPVKRPSL